MEPGPCRFRIDGLPCPCTGGMFDVTNGPLEPTLSCQKEDCRHELRHHFLTYDNLALIGLSSPPITIDTLTLYEQPMSEKSSRPVSHRNGIPGIKQKWVKMVDRADRLLERIRILTPKSPIDLATPAEKLIPLPFPSLLPILPRDRFDLDRDNNWSYMAREKFEELLEGVNEPLEGPDVGLWFYGTAGYGKSHLLAALVCYLLSTGSQVVYIPDCQACLGDPVEYVRAAMLLAWAGNTALQMQIMGLKTRLDILQFFNDRATEGCWVVFIIDQMNALEPEGKNAGSAHKIRRPLTTTKLPLRVRSYGLEGGKDAKSAGVAQNDAKEASLETWLYECSSQHMTVVGLSANNTSFSRLQQSQRSHSRVNAYGGLTEVGERWIGTLGSANMMFEAEMRCWWERNRSVSYAGYTKLEVEDITGSIPLLLDGCVVNGEIDLSALPLIIVSEQVLQFMEERYQEGQGVWSRYWDHMKACVTHGAVPNDVPLRAIDHRFSFETTVFGIAVGSYTCGVAREAVAKGLRLHRGTPGDHQSLLEPLRILTPYSPSIAESCIKQAVLSLIAKRSLRFGDNTISSLDTTLYPGDFPEVVGTGSRPWLYCPLKFDFGGIDGIIISTDRTRKRPRCHLLPLQITIADARESSEILFFSQWSHWINTLGFTDVEVEYVWIVGSGSPSVKDFNERTRERQGIKFLNPPYTRRTIALRDLSPDIHSELRYAQARRTG